METEKIETVLKDAVDSIRKTPAVRRRKNVSYALVVKVGYEEIEKLRNDGYSYDIICKILSENSLLDADANPKNLCTAFLRETKRRLSRQKANQSIFRESNVPAEKADSRAVNPNKAIQNNGGEAIKTEGEKERVRPSMGTVVNTGLGQIIKRPDGSFEY